MSEDNNTGNNLVTTERGKMQARDMKIGSAGINFTNAAEVMAFANMMAQAGQAVRKQFRENPGACLAIVDDAVRFGMSPFFLARKAYVVNDEIAYEAQVIAAIIISRAPIKDLPDYEFEGEGPTRMCRVMVETSTGKVITHDSPQIKDIKVKNSPLWTSDPDQQLGYYTIRALARRNFPHVLGGVYDLEEAAAARARDITPTPEERPKSRLGELLEAGAEKKRLEIEARASEPGEKTDAAPEATQPAQDAAAPEPAAKAPLEPETQPAPSPAPAAPAPAPEPENQWKPAEQEILDKLTTDLAGAKEPDDIDALLVEFGPTMKGKRKVFVEHCNGLVEARREELTPKKVSAAKTLL